MMFKIDYCLNDQSDEIETEYFDTPERAERRARYLSKKHHGGGWDGPCVYVFKSHGARGQRVFFAGLTFGQDAGYRQDVADFRRG